jgi:hypothetical protein
MIPAESTVISNYLVLGDTSFMNVPALQIQRSDSLSAGGQGVEGQHRILVSAKGTGLTDLYVDVTTGRLLGARGLQSTVVDITTSGRLSQFLQHVTESVAITQP